MSYQKVQRHFFNTFFLIALYALFPQTANAERPPDANCPGGYDDYDVC
jgi:hypothetical protein